MSGRSPWRPCVFFASLPFLLFVARPQVPFGFLLTYACLFGIGQFSFLFVGLKIGLPTGIASLLLQLQAVFTPALALALLREPFSRYTAAAMVLSLAGLVAILSASWHIEGAAVPEPFGVGAAQCRMSSSATASRKAMSTSRTLL